VLVQPSRQMSQFTGLLRQMTKMASHPNSLLYNIQLERARQKFVQGQLDDGKGGAVTLGAPKDERGESLMGLEKKTGADTMKMNENKDGHTTVRAEDEPREENIASGQNGRPSKTDQMDQMDQI
jgi:uncharacterized low-complexity protein